jgi:hypothetical protein
MAQGPFSIAPSAEICLPVASEAWTKPQAERWKTNSFWLLPYGTITYSDTLDNPIRNVRFAARYITWSSPRPIKIPDFWIYNELPLGQSIIFETGAQVQQQPK